MDYKTMTLQELAVARENIQKQIDVLNELDEKLIAELGERAKERTHSALHHMFGF